MTSVSLFVKPNIMGATESTILIGSVSPPADFSGDIHAELDRLWAEWREEVAEPDTDSQFVEWLVQKGWTELVCPDTHTFED